MYEFIVMTITTLILISPTIFIKYIINHMMSIIKFYICLEQIIKLQLEV